MKKFALLAPLAAALVLTGCSDPKDPTADNFKMALEKYYKEDGCQGFKLISFLEVKWPIVEDARVHNLPVLPQLEKLGLVSSTLLKREGSNRLQLSYDLTETGKKMLKAPRVDTFCAYDFEVLSVDKWTEPRRLGDETYVVVDFTAKPVNVQPWSKLPEAKRLLVDGNSKGLKLQRILNLTDNGWEVDP